jgi:hypothetical protein
MSAAPKMDYADAAATAAKQKDSKKEDFLEYCLSELCWGAYDFGYPDKDCPDGKIDQRIVDMVKENLPLLVEEKQYKVAIDEEFINELHDRILEEVTAQKGDESNIYYCGRPQHDYTRLQHDGDGGYYCEECDNECEECGYCHHYTDKKCPVGDECEDYVKWREDEESDCDEAAAEAKATKAALKEAAKQLKEEKKAAAKLVREEKKAATKLLNDEKKAAAKQLKDEKKAAAKAAKVALAAFNKIPDDLAAHSWVFEGKKVFAMANGGGVWERDAADKIGKWVGKYNPATGVLDTTAVEPDEYDE